MRVKNISGTGSRTCSCGSWLNHWVKYSPQPLPAHCVEIFCPSRPEVGAHVQRDDHSGDLDWYIVPLCSEHNGRTGRTFMVPDDMLVSANVNETCGRRK